MSEELKKGVKTTEWWTAILLGAPAAIVAVLTALQGHPWVAAGIAGAVVVLPIVYILGRSWVKAEREKQVDFIPPKWEDRLERIFDALNEINNALPHGQAQAKKK